MYNEVIKQLLKKLDIIPERLLAMYLMKKYNLTENMAHQAIHAACRNRSAYRVGDCVARAPFIEYTSAEKKRAKAFRVFLEFLSQAESFRIADYPFILSFATGKNYVQVCYIERGAELSGSMVISNIPVPSIERPTIKRIAILEDGCNIAMIKSAGISHFCNVSDEFSLKIIKKTDPKTAWNDVPENR